MSNSLSILCIGDPHIRIEEQEDIHSYFNELTTILNTIDNLDFIIILGDVLHNHSILHTGSLNLATEFFKICKKM